MRTSLLTVYDKKRQAVCEHRDPSQWVKGHDKDVCVNDQWEHKQEAFNSRNTGSKFLILSPETEKMPSRANIPQNTMTVYELEEDICKL